MPENSTCPGGRAESGYVEDVPMCRFRHPIPDCGSSRGSCSGHCPCGDELERILAALACQNQLLVDLLGAVNCLTAALLAEHTT